MRGKKIIHNENKDKFENCTKKKNERKKEKGKKVSEKGSKPNNPTREN